jgi:NADPH-dependent 2,4-dienoyl-CoA reductase/sulfur reductase-like enzyme/rhodanese-related sulfurtransferase
MTRRVMIVGASAAGLRCGARLRRLQPDWRITVLEKETAFSFAACGFPYVLSGDIDSLDDLRSTAWGAQRDRRFFEDVKGLEVLEGYRVLAIDPEKKTLDAEGPDGGVRLGWDELVLATGASPAHIPGQPAHPRVRNFHVGEDVASLKRGLIHSEIGHVAVIGSGLVGIELAEAFRSLWGAEVTVVESADHPLPRMLDREAGALVRSALEAEGVTVRCGALVERIEADDAGVTVLCGGEPIRADMAVVAVGVRPAVELAGTAGVTLGKTGAIAVDRRFATSVPHIWAVGDCIEVRHAVSGEKVHCPLGSLANRQGRVLAGILAGREERFNSVAGAMAVKVFGLSVAVAGCSLGEARRLGFHAEAVWMTTDDRAHYWPESEDVHIQLVFEPETLRLLGVQAVGKGRVVDLVDVAAQLLLRGVPVGELEEIEHCYAPPFAPALAPLTVAAFVARNHVEGVCCTSPLAQLEGHRILDVRLVSEQEARPWRWGESLHIPVEELRGRMAELDHSAPWLVVCERGTRSAEAVNWLRQQDINAWYLGGGMIWRCNALGGDA